MTISKQTIEETLAGPTAKTTHHCAGCSALRTEDWSFQEENDGVDRGTDAKCTATDPHKHISSYWSASDQTPDWCPALALSALSRDGGVMPPIWEAKYLRPDARVCKEDDVRQALSQSNAHEAAPYAHEFGKPNGDGTYCVVIEKGGLGYASKFAVSDWPIKPLYAHPPRPETVVSEELAQAALSLQASSWEGDYLNEVRVNREKLDHVAALARSALSPNKENDRG